MKVSKSKLIARAKKIKFLILDIDGTLTDGRIIYDSQGKDLKFFDVHDGLGVFLLKKAKIKTVLVTAKGSLAIKFRAKDMQVEDVYQDMPFKRKVYDKILKKYRLRNEQICFMGDDLVDLNPIKRAGLSVTVPSACLELRKSADMITKKQGGHGAVRELAEFILKSKGKWQEVIRDYQ